MPRIVFLLIGNPPVHSPSCLRIDHAKLYAAAFKPNSAFFEIFGAEGFSALKKVIDAIPADIPIILDCKRGDIDTTAEVIFKRISLSDFV